MLLSWTDNDEPDLAGYNVYRSDVSGGPYVLLNAGLLLAAGYEDATVVNGVTYHYVVTAVDTSGNDSGTGAEVAGIPDGAGSCGGSPTSDPWIN